tara:strand:- start:1111 stop:1470 length:360 start_codon:yes stop_codon:yes gene_type:complete
MMSNRDVICSFNETGRSSDTPDDTFTIAGAVRLFNIWMTRGGSSTDSIVILKNKDSSGDVLLKFDWNTASWPSANTNVEIPGGGILFPDGLYFDTGNGSTGSNISTCQIRTVTLLYQSG